MSRLRLFCGFLMLPFLGGTLAFFAFPLFAQSLTNQIGGSFSNDAAMSFAAGAFIVAVVVTLIAVPIALVRLRKGPVTFGESFVAGVALGNAPFLTVAILIVIVQLFAGTPPGHGDMWYGATGAFRTIAMSTLMGAVLGSAFWLIAICGREHPTN